MATSGLVNLASSATGLTYLANNILAQYGADISTLTTADYDLALLMLNYYMNHTQATNAAGFLWKRSVAYLFMPNNQLVYTLANSATGDNCTENYNSCVVQTAALASATAITVDSTAGMTTGDNCIITNAEGTFMLFMGALPTITVTSATVITLSSGLTENIAVGLRLFTYTTKIDKPVHVYSFSLRTYNSLGTPAPFSDRPIDSITFDDYQTVVTEKANVGEPVAAAYLPLRNIGALYVQGLTEDPTTKVLMLVIQKQVQYLSTGSDEPDYPPEWFLCLAFKLAYYLSWVLEFDVTTRESLNTEAKVLFTEVSNSDIQLAPTKFVVGRR